MKRYHELLASSQGRRFASEQDITAYLDAEQITDVESRIAFKHAMFAQGELGTDATVAIGSLATDRARQPTPGTTATPEIDRLMRRASLDPQGSYTDGEVTSAFLGSDLEIPERVAIRHHLASMGRLRAGASTIRPTPRPGMQATREMSASTPRPKRNILRDPQTGQAITIKGYSW